MCYIQYEIIRLLHLIFKNLTYFSEIFPYYFAGFNVDLRLWADRFSRMTTIREVYFCDGAGCGRKGISLPKLSECACGAREVVDVDFAPHIPTQRGAY